jgi:hypothetical protein
MTKTVCGRAKRMRLLTERLCNLPTPLLLSDKLEQLCHDSGTPEIINNDQSATPCLRRRAHGR